MYRQLHGTQHHGAGVSDIINRSWRISGGLIRASSVTEIENFEYVFILGCLGEDFDFLQPSLEVNRLPLYKICSTLQ